VSYNRKELLTLRKRLSSLPVFCWVRVAHLVIKFVLSYCVLRSLFRVVMSVIISVLKRCPVSLYPQLFIGGLASDLHYL